MSSGRVTIVEVGPRDGFQAVAPLIPTETKIAIIEHLYRSGLRRIEATSFVSPKAVPQLADAVEVLAAAGALPGLDVQVLTPNRVYAERALEAGARHLAFVLSVSDSHNLRNVRRLSRDSAQDYAAIAAAIPGDIKIRLNLATAFDCPFGGTIDPSRALAILDLVVPVRPDAEICMCDTTGRAVPQAVQELFERARERFPSLKRWAFHGHDTYGVGVANAIAAWQSGVRVIDASIAGLGGCPFAPGATGNTATEDLVWMFEKMGIATGIDLGRLLQVSDRAAALPGGQPGGRVRTALGNSLCADDAQ